jgi:formyl-CoA transferase
MVTQLDWYTGLGTPIKFSRTKGGTRRPPPTFNQHGEEVLAQHGYTEKEIADLRDAGIMHVTRRV